MNYDEDRELTRYVWDHFQSLFTEFERQVGRAIHARGKAATSSSPALAEFVNLRWGAIADAAIDAALADGFETFRRRVRDRLLAEYQPTVRVNRCRRCRRVVRAPLARQCLWCGFTWFDDDTQTR